MANQNERISTAQRGYGHRWQQASRQYLAANPWCVFHRARGQDVPARAVDHIEAPRLGDAIASGDEDRIAEARRLFWNRKNWQGLCFHCHNSIKQAQEKSGRFGGCDADGMPLDGNHHWNR